MTGSGGRHVFDAIGMTRVVIEDGKVVSVGTPELDYCPIYAKRFGTDKITPEMIRSLSPPLWNL